MSHTCCSVVVVVVVVLLGQIFVVVVVVGAVVVHVLQAKSASSATLAANGKGTRLWGRCQRHSLGRGLAFRGKGMM